MRYLIISNRQFESVYPRDEYLFGGFFMNEIKAEIVDCMIYDFVIEIFLYTFIRVCLILIFLILFLRTDVKMMLCVNC